MLLGAVTSTLLLSTYFVQGIHNHCHNLQAGPNPVPIRNFHYIGVTSPLSWAGLNPANIKWSTANVQSPMNIEHDVVPLSKTHLQLSIPNVKSAEFENLGSTVEVAINGTTILEGKTYSLGQYHVHTPTEHPIDMQFIQWKCISSTLHLVSCWKTSQLSILQTSPRGPLQTIPHRKLIHHRPTLFLRHHRFLQHCSPVQIYWIADNASVHWRCRFPCQGYFPANEPESIFGVQGCVEVECEVCTECAREGEFNWGGCRSIARVDFDCT